MALKFLNFTAILLVALVTGLAFAHVLESPAKMQYSAHLYITLQQSLYVQWGPPQVGGFLEPAAITTTGASAATKSSNRRALTPMRRVRLSQLPSGSKAGLSVKV